MAGEPVAPSSYGFYDGVLGYDGVALYQSPGTTLPVSWDFSSVDRVWEDFTSVDGFELKLLVTPDPGSFASIGIITSGDSQSFAEINPSPGFIQSLIDYSVTKQLSNGGFYVKTRDVVGTSSGQAVFDSASWEALRDVVKSVVKSNPTAWFVMDIGGLEEYLTYARLSQEPTGSRVSTDLVTVTIELVETV